MTILEFHADLARVADSLEKIAFLLEKLAFPPPPADLKVQQATLDDLKYVDEAAILQQKQEQQEFAERFQVVPDSPAFQRELVAWVTEMRMIHGEQWQPPEEWKTIFAEVYQGFDGQAPAAAAGER